MTIFSVQAETLLIGGSGTDLGTFRLLASAYQNHHPEVTFRVLDSLGSGGGLKALKKNRISIALLSRAPKPHERYVTMKTMHYAYTPMVMAVSRMSNIETIQSEDVFNIYIGQMKKWSDGRVVRPVFRPITDSDTRLLLDHIGDCESCLRKGLQRHGIPIARSDQESADMIARIPGAIGTSTLSLILSENRPLKALRLDGVEPSAENIINQTYPMYKDLYLAFMQDSASDHIFKFVEFIYSDEGKAILKKTGHALVGANP